MSGRHDRAERRVMSWFVRHRPEGDTSAEAVAVAVEVNAPTPADAVDEVRATLPKDRIVTSVASY
jgi:hypothetical protein